MRRASIFWAAICAILSINGVGIDRASAEIIVVSQWNHIWGGDPNDDYFEDYDLSGPTGLSENTESHESFGYIRANSHASGGTIAIVGANAGGTDLVKT